MHRTLRGMDTGFSANQLYSACRLEMTHHFPDGTHCTDLEGTGFLVQFPAGDSRIGLVTNKHLANAEFYNPLENPASVLTSVKVQWWQSKNMLLEHVINDPQPLYHSDPLFDVAVIPIFSKPNLPIEIGGTHYGDLVQFIADTNGTDQLLFNHAHSWEYLLQCEELWPQIEPGEFVTFPGYPVWYDHLENRPVMRSGVIASDPQTEYRLTDGERTKDDSGCQVLFDAFSTKGNSGGPVFIAQRGLPPIDLRAPTPGGGTAVYGKLAFDNYRKSFLVGINASHYNETGISRTNEHAGLSRMHKLSVIMDILRANKGTYGREAQQISLMVPAEGVSKVSVKARIANKDRDESIMRLRREGKTFIAIAAEVGCSSSTVSRVVKRRNLAVRR